MNVQTDPERELEAAEEVVREEGARLRQRAQQLRRRGFLDIADELEAHALGLQETADFIASQIENRTPSS